jgi:hypothetical protein
MNKFIKNIILESEEFNDKNDLFKPNGLNKRRQKQEEERKNFLSKINLNLKEIKIAYQNENWKSNPEKLFLRFFSQFHLDKKYDEFWNGYFLLDENNKRRIAWDLKNHVFYISYHDIWQIFKEQFKWNYNKIQNFMRKMLEEHFNLNDFFTPRRARILHWSPKPEYFINHHN